MHCFGLLKKDSSRRILSRDCALYGGEDVPHRKIGGIDAYVKNVPGLERAVRMLMGIGLVAASPPAGGSLANAAGDHFCHRPSQGSGQPT
jgi:hypothetical protein